MPIVPRVIFTPGRRFKEMLNNIRYQKERATSKRH